jgi:hypothetical protein
LRTGRCHLPFTSPTSTPTPISALVTPGTYLLTELVREAPAHRTHPQTGSAGLNDGNHLAFAVACRWITDLTYVYCDGGGSDELHLVMQGFDRGADHIQLPVVTPREVDRILRRTASPVPESLEAPVPYRSMRWDSFQAGQPYDFICLTRSPPYCPTTADPLFKAIERTFVGDAVPSGAA